MEQFLHQGNVDYRSVSIRCSNKHLHAALQAKAVCELPSSAQALPQGARCSGGSSLIWKETELVEALLIQNS